MTHSPPSPTLSKSIFYCMGRWGVLPTNIPPKVGKFTALMGYKSWELKLGNWELSILLCGRTGANLSLDKSLAGIDCGCGLKCSYCCRFSLFFFEDFPNHAGRFSSYISILSLSLSFLFLSF